MTTRKVVLAIAVLLVAVPLMAHAPSGAIFTTVADGSEVNFNIYPAKTAVYLDGGPGPGAPQGAAGLDDGTYVFQVTDPSGKTLLSTDKAKCRQFIVSAGIITSVVATGCQHLTGNDIDHPPAITVQLMPYNDTPNPGGVYKAWAVRLDDFLAGCAALGKPNGLEVVDCGKTAGNSHGFIPSHSKTDNFKVKTGGPREIDTRFINFDNGQVLTGLSLKWFDTLGASNKKWAAVQNWANDPNNNRFAHVEAVENGVHKIEIADQAGCKVEAIEYSNGTDPYTTIWGADTISADIQKQSKSETFYIYVYCTVQ